MTGRRRREIPEKFLLAGLFLALLLAAYSDPLFRRRNFGGRDLLAYNLPMENAIHDAYSRGRLPLWMSEVSGGRPLLPNPNAGALYPFRPLLAPAPFPVAVKIFPVLHWTLAGLGILFLLLHLGVSRSGAWIGAVTYAFSGVAVAEVFFPHILPGLALLPWILWALARHWRSLASRLFALALLFALEMLAGDVFSVALSILCACLWILLEESPGQKGRELAWLTVSLVLALLAAAPQVVATALWIPETGRAVTGMDLGESLQFSIPPARLLELVVPYPFGPTYALDLSRFWTRTVFRGKAIGLFTTLYAGAFAVIAAWRLRRGRIPGARFGRALGASALTLAVLPSLVPASWLKLPSPLPLRNPEKFAVGLSMALAILAGLAFDRLRERPPRAAGGLAVAATLGFIAVSAWRWTEPVGRAALKLAGEPPGAARLAGTELSVAFTEAALFWIVTVVAVEAGASLSRPSRAVAVILLTLVPIAANRRIARTFAEDAIFGPTAFARYLFRVDPNREYRTIGVSAYRAPSDLQEKATASDPGVIEYSRVKWIDFFPSLWRRGQVFNDDFDRGDLSRMRSLRRLSFIASGYRDARAFFGAVALRWAIRFRDQEPLPGYRRIGGDSLVDWDEHERAYPDIRLLTDWVEEPGAVEALRDLPRLAPGQVVVESGRAARGAARPGRLTIFEKSPERLRLGAECPDPTWLFVLRGFWKHRTVLVDGRLVEDAPAQLAFSAVRIPGGRHVVEWKEGLPGWPASAAGPVLIALACAGVSARARRRLSSVANP